MKKIRFQQKYNTTTKKAMNINPKQFLNINQMITRYSKVLTIQKPFEPIFMYKEHAGHCQTRKINEHEISNTKTPRAIVKTWGIAIPVCENNKNMTGLVLFQHHQ